MYPTAIDAMVAQPHVDDRARELGEAVRIVLARTAEADWRAADRARVPASWVAALACATADEALAKLGWPTVEGFLPKTVAMLRDRLAGLGVLLALSEPPSLLYFFVIDDEVTAFEGLLPAEADALHERKPADVAAMQRLHDGWFDFYSGDLGPMPEKEWPVIGAALPDRDKLIGVASKGSAIAGFEPGAPGAPARVLWPDDGIVETPGSLFDAVDDWVSAALEPAEVQD